jgi:MerR family Zn(II)-responsive transcriptional regulator of zntA
MQAAVLQIGEVAKKADVSVRTVRYDEELGLLEPLLRTSGGTRLYSEAQVTRLRFIRRLRDLGLGLEKIKLALGANASAQNKQERVARTLQVLEMEQQRAEEQLAALTQLRAEVQSALSKVKECALCSAPECPECCERRAYLL